jgi:dihydrofolate reductase
MSGRLILDVSMSLDGYIAQPDDDPGVLHDWVFRDAEARPARRGGGVFADDPVLLEYFERTGAVLMGRRTFDLGEGPWGDDPPFQVPVFVLTQDAHEPLDKGATTFTFVTGGLTAAVDGARIAAGDKDVGVMGASVAQQLLEAGLLDEVQIHLIPVLFGRGVRLFEPFESGHVALELTRLVDAPGVTHLRFGVAKRPGDG